MASKSPWYYIIHWIRFYFGAHLLFSGIRYAVTGYVPDIPGVGGEWVQANANIYLYQIIKYLEIVTGAMIFFNRLPLLGLILEMPATVNIFWLNTIIVASPEMPRQYFTGPQELFLNGFLLWRIAAGCMPPSSQNWSRCGCGMETKPIKKALVEKSPNNLRIDRHEQK